ncbi:protein-glutamate O-methyltransferase CheR [Candidatus Berkiella cookevillensis]|uniref:Chemotaxis protein methyltransferase Cher2 n=1 Tax=Candidatus Berkiella cookevillensis TaxID=437022 RepID=A0A0Q9YRW4_9GAMM|nr:CheR family methyltransferase [Candidatus Berkiella cookevillensis]MCS5708831.1 protein-glutamate O-methyltransferase CheR [Candidatus Berkiella cookevillensis]
MSVKVEDKELLELELLTQAIKMLYGWDFGQYKKESLRRSANRLASKHNLKNISELIPKLFCNELLLNDLLNCFSIPVTEMFRDPGFFLTLRKKIIPILKTYPFIKIWHVGCASGQEVYSMAILLHEEGMYDRARIYGTDINPLQLKKAKEGIFEVDQLDVYKENYYKSGGKHDLMDYFSLKYDAFIFNNKLRKNIFFFEHNIAQDHAFGEMNLILCRNVLIYFDATLQCRAINLFNESLCFGGALCLGVKESLDFMSINPGLELFDKEWKIYKKGFV